MMDDDDEHDELLGLGASTATTSSLIRVRDAETVMRAVSAFADHPQVLQVILN